MGEIEEPNAGAGEQETPSGASPADPSQELGPDAGQDGQGADEEAPRPYGSLLVPLIVVPAIIVMVLVLVFVLFAGVVGEEATPRENLRTMLDGGKNARQQAAFNLVRQTLEAWQVEEEGGQSDWQLDEAFVPELVDAWERAPEDEVVTRLVLAILLAGSGEGVDRLVELLELPERVDAGAELRFKVVGALALLGDRVEGEDREEAAQALIELVNHPDEGLRGAATVALQSFPGPATVAALQGLLQSSSLVLRGNAALSLAELGDDSGEAVLLELLEPDAYEVERGDDNRKWASQRLVSESRRRALQTLAARGLGPDQATLERFADDPDLEFRGVVRGLLAD